MEFQEFNRIANKRWRVRLAIGFAVLVVLPALVFWENRSIDGMWFSSNRSYLVPADSAILKNFMGGAVPSSAVIEKVYFQAQGRFELVIGPGAWEGWCAQYALSAPEHVASQLVSQSGAIEFTPAMRQAQKYGDFTWGEADRALVCLNLPDKILFALLSWDQPRSFWDLSIESVLVYQVPWPAHPQPKGYIGVIKEHGSPDVQVIVMTRPDLHPNPWW